MAALEFDIVGMAEVVALLKALPEAMAGEAEHIIVFSGNATVGALKRRYPIGPSYKGHKGGNLVKGVDVTIKRKGVSTTAVVRSRAPHAHLYEFGTEVRYYKGVNLGRMRPTHVFGQELARSRREVAANLRGLLERHGLQVKAS